MEERRVRFDIEPGVGALPIRFGMQRAEVRSLLGPPETTTTTWDKSGTSDYWFRSTVTVGYDLDGIVDHVGFSPGGYELCLKGSVLWTAGEHPDPNPVLLRTDPDPVERLGFLVFNRVCVTTTGYHDDDEFQRALTVYPPGKWDEELAEATTPDLDRYRQGGEQRHS
jgi:hypothetical protein